MKAVQVRLSVVSNRLHTLVVQSIQWVGHRYTRPHSSTPQRNEAVAPVIFTACPCESPQAIDRGDSPVF
jgi:hypothetical protein